MVDDRDSLSVWSDRLFTEEMLSQLSEIVAVGAKPGEGTIAFTRRVSESLPAMHFRLRGLNLKEAIALANEHGAPVTAYIVLGRVHWIEAPPLAVGRESGWRLEISDPEFRADGMVSKSSSWTLKHWKKLPS